MGKILVTGATGNIGTYVVDELINRGEQVKVASSKNNPVTPKGAEAVLFDFLNPETYANALAEVDRVFLVRPPQLAKPKKDMLPFIRAMKNKAIRQVVFVSLMGVEKNPIVPHRKIETMIRKLEIPFTFLRPGFFMQNLSTTHREEIANLNEIFVPVGKARTSFIDTRDIAAVAVNCLIEENHINTCYTLTGNKSIDYYEVAETLSEVLEKRVEYKNPSLFEFRRETIRRGIKKEFANVMTMLYLMTSLGTANKVTQDVERVLKREPHSFKEFAVDHKNVWIKKRKD